MEVKKNLSAKKAMVIGIVFCGTYLLSYFVRKFLGLARVEILEIGIFKSVQLDSMQSVFLLMYAAGQLVNGIIGDFVSPKRMISIGYLLSGASIIVFPLTKLYWISLFCFAVLGYGLSMLRGPIMKLVSENTEPSHARIICAFFSFVAYVAPFIATFFINWFGWSYSYILSGILLLAVSFGLYIYITAMEKKKVFVPQISAETPTRFSFKEVGKIFSLPNFVFFFFIGGLVEIIGTTVGYWLPSFIEGYLGQSKIFSNVVTSVISAISAVSAFLALVFLRLTKGKLRALIMILFAGAGVAFVSLLLIKSLWMNLFMLLLGMLLVACVSALLWSAYIPSLADSGKVSGANGILDCAGYLFASGANVVFSLLAGSAENPNWTRLVLAWVGVVAIGFLLPLFKREEKQQESSL